MQTRNFEIIFVDFDRKVGTVLIRNPGAKLCAEIYPIPNPGDFARLTRYDPNPNFPIGVYPLNEHAPESLADCEAIATLAGYGIFPRAIFTRATQ